MIISTLTDRMGNQLFQYAAGRALAIKNDTILKINKKKFEINPSPVAKYELHHFRIPQNFATNQEINEYLWLKDSLIFRGMRKIYPKHTYFEKSFDYDRCFERLGAKVGLRGFWQSYKYFDSISDIIREECQVVHPISGLNQVLSNEMRQVNSVAVHVRRGDYVSNPKTHVIFGTCSLDYYKKAIGLIAERVQNPKFYFFSDDIDWVRENLKVPYSSTYISHNTGEKSYEDLRLMSHCKHNVIANSTFSWWGAWLNQNQNKIVVAPKNWFTDPQKRTDDLCPLDWLRI